MDQQELSDEQQKIFDEILNEATHSFFEFYRLRKERNGFLSFDEYLASISGVPK